MRGAWRLYSQNQTSPEKEMNDALLVIRLPKQLRQAFKIVCAKRGVTMKSIVIAAIEKEAGRPEPVKK
jgi:hypothetical protein